DSSKRDDRFNLNNSTFCPLCNEDHKKESLWNDIRGEWDAGEYCKEQTYRIKYKDPLNHRTLIVS
ncbi:14899_t:CDS:1, partial [Funneliformis mosseae]